MRIGVPTEVKNNEYRVAITPVGVHELVEHGHTVLVQRGAGLGSAVPDEEYAAQGATILPSADEVWGEAEMVMKVKEPVEAEYHRLRSDLVLFAYLHLAAERRLTEALLAALPGGGARPVALPGAPPGATEVPTGCAFAPRCPRAWERCLDEPPPLRDGVACIEAEVAG